MASLLPKPGLRTMGWDVTPGPPALPLVRALGYLAPSWLALPWVGWVCIGTPAECGAHWGGAEALGRGCLA